MIHNRGPRQVPCGMPHSRKRLLERVLEMETHLLAINYEVHQSNGAPEIPNEICTLRRSTL